MIELMLIMLIPQCGKFKYGEYGFSTIGGGSYSRE